MDSGRILKFLKISVREIENSNNMIVYYWNHFFLKFLFGTSEAYELQSSETNRYPEHLARGLSTGVKSLETFDEISFYWKSKSESAWQSSL